MESTIISSVDNLWVLIAGILVMFMQPGFMLVETGFTRSKNSVNIVMKNFMDFSVGAITYWAFGFALAYGGSTLGGFIAYGNFFLEGDSTTYFFQVVFAATAATIVSGSVAERTKFSSYLLFQPFICGVIYPIVTHWVWSGQGWLTDLGFIDFAGSGVVHMVGGFAALGLSVQDMTLLRNQARESDIYLKVVKNTLSKRAFEETDFKCLVEDLNGPIIIALSKEDLASPARLFKNFSKDNEQLKTVGLAINGEAFPVSDIDRISKLPTKDEAYSMLLGLMKAPIEKAVSLMNEIPTKFVRVVNAQKDTQEEVS